ncbi:MAG: HEPN domain-containing protein [Nitrosotalea sp.]
MKPTKSYLKWCAKQNKGIKLVNASASLQKAYLKKSENAIKSMNANAKAGIDEWVVSTSYYAKYFAVYALLSRLGIKCEIHDCTLSIFEYLFLTEISAKAMQDLQQSKDDRVDAQYYTETIKTDQNALIADTKDFVLKIQEIIDKLTSSKIVTYQNKLKSAL